MCDNIPVSDLTVDGLPRIGIYLECDDVLLSSGTYGIGALAPRMIDIMLAYEDSLVSLDTVSGAIIVRVPTSYASSFDRHIAVATLSVSTTTGVASPRQRSRTERAFNRT
ncbi:hypothetical protein [Burkholderia sp. IMCC1007]|uniref:hypothetical protein n=1 Tax=Burkholderia sp. IMCC1007 TaxID=3004104 RepID=UPI0022B3C6EA|nr:hypothetical protein [Burkholderia sp. IMCC1007]